MPDRLWAHRLARLLPRAAARDLYLPALHDLDREHRYPPGYIGGVAVLFVETLRLALIEHLTTTRLRDREAAPTREVWFTMLRRDIKHALRLFVREPAFTATVVLTLALGIGANTALFAVIEAVLLRPLPYTAAEQLVIVRHRDLRTGISKEHIAIGDFVDLKARQQVLEQFAGFSAVNSTLVSDGESLRIEGLAATSNLFDVFAMQPALGRMFSDDDTRKGAQPVVVLGHQLWESRFSSDPSIVGRSIQLGTTRRLIVGVAPQGFQFPPHRRTDVIIPVVVPPTAPAARKSDWIFGVGRLRAGGNTASANAALGALAQQFEREHPQQNQGSSYYALSLRDELVGNTKRPLLVLFAAVGLVLLIACINVGNLLLARSLSRHTEMALRQALGAERRQIIAQTLTEGLVLSSVGAVVGVLVAWRAVPAIVAIVPTAFPIPGLEEVSINPVVVLFALATSLVSGLLFSAVACLGLARNASRDALAADRRTTLGRSPRRAASMLVASEVALAVVLLLGAGLTLRSFANLIAVNPGFRTDGVLTMQLQLPPGRYTDAASRRAAYDRLFAAIDALPEVDAIGAAAVTPLTGNNWTVAFERVDRPVPAGERPPDVGWQSASSGYLQALEIPLLAGRRFDARDAASKRPVVLVSDAIRNQYFRGEDPIGHELRLGPDTSAEIIGVVGDIRRAALSDSPRADMYFSFEQQPPPATTLFLRVDGVPESVVPTLRATVRALEPNALVFDVRPFSAIASQSAAIPNLAMRVLAGFAVLALTLAGVGIYGVMSYTVRRRTRELGTRLALGATRVDILRLVLRQASMLVLAGLAIGIAIGVLATRSLAAVLHGVTPWDPLAITLAAVILALTALAASYLPARRAARIDPARTLSAE